MSTSVLTRRGPASVKQADDSNDGQDVPFERAFANVAHAFLQDKAPGLLPYEAGFQTLERSEDNSRAVGVFGFRVGTQWLLVPVFAVNGDLKGDSIYVKNQDSFVPLRENWVNYLINRKPTVLGGAVTRDSRRLGVRQPDYTRMTHSPGKFAAYQPPWLQDALPALAYAAMTNPDTDPRYKGLRQLPDLIRDGGLKVANALRAVISAYPRLGTAIDRFYGKEVHDALTTVKESTLKAIKESRSILRPHPTKTAATKPLSVLGTMAPEHPMKTGALQVYTYDKERLSKIRTLPEPDAEKLMEESVLITDKRPDPDVAKIVNVRVKRAFTNPDETGLYEVLTKPGEFRRCAVVVSPHFTNGRALWATLIDADEPHSWVNLHPSCIWASQKFSDEDWREWVGKFKSANKLEMGSQYVLLDPDHCDGTASFIVGGQIGGSEEEYRVYDVRFDMYSERPREAELRTTDPRRFALRQIARSGDFYDRWVDGERIHTGVSAVKLRSRSGDLYVPSRFKALKIEDADYDEEQWVPPTSDISKPDRNIKSLTGGKGRSKTTIMAPGGIIDPEFNLWMKVGGYTAELRLRAGHGAIWINDTELTKQAALLALVVNHAFREADAREAIKLAEEQARTIEGGPAILRVMYPDYVKSATPYGSRDDPYGPAGLISSAPFSPGFPDPVMGAGSMMTSDYPTQLPQQLFQQVSGTFPDDANREMMRANAPVIPDPSAAAVVDEASRQGQREVFDTSMLGVLLRTSDDEDLDASYTKDLMKGLDRLGRKLFMLCWHRDRFEERYGKQTVPVLENGMRNVYRGLGDIVLEMKQNAVQADPQRDMKRTDMEALASS